MARQRKHEELQGLFGSDLEFLIVELTVGALAYRNRDILGWGIFTLPLFYVLTSNNFYYNIRVH